MPTYVYEYVLPDGKAGKQFEWRQAMTEPPLQHHPDNGRPVRRVIQPPMIAGKWTERGMKNALSDRSLAAKGFTKYVKSSEGRYEKTAGSGPDRLST
jgi:hypothetical protein